MGVSRLVLTMVAAGDIDRLAAHQNQRQIRDGP